MQDVTQVIVAIEQGDPQAAQTLLPLVYEELRRLAAIKLADERVTHTLQPTALVHEAYLRLCDGGGQNYQDRRHFFAVAAITMRRILVDAARAKRSMKRGGDCQRVELVDPCAPQLDERLLDLDEALAKLAQCDPLKAQIVELRYFVGLTIDQAATILGVSPSTVDRAWVYARAWLQAELAEAS